jgi:Skp family chaperone for outer membrane proteins
VLPAGVEELFLPARPGQESITYRPRIAAASRLHYVDAKSGLDAWRSLALLAPLEDDGRPAWDEATEVASLGSGGAPIEGAVFAELPAALLRAPGYAAAGKALAAHLFEHAAVELLRCAPLKLASQPGESEGDFRARLAHALHERRDEELGKLRQKHAAKLRTLEDQLRRAEGRAARERAQYSQRTVDSAVAIGASVLGAIFGGRRAAASRATAAARSAGRVFGEKGDVARADENLEVLRQRRDEQLAAIEAEAAALTASLDASSVELERVRIAPRKADIAIGRVVLAWEPWRHGPDGLPQPAWPPA